MPFPVDVCIDSVKRKFTNRTVILIDKNNYSEYIDIPQYMLNKVESGAMLLAHLADYIRIALLQKYGGVWLDSTFYVCGDLDNELSNYSFYSINHGGKRDWVASKDLWSIGFLACLRNYILMRFCKEIMEEYWRNEPVEIAYLFSDYIIAIGYEIIKEFHRDVDQLPINNPNCFIFEQIGNEKTDNETYERIRSNTNLFQLSYKMKWEKGDTFMRNLINQ